MNHQNLSQNQEDLYSHLNSAQLQGVQSIEGPLLILAGAGTGKTRVLTSRLAHIFLTQPQIAPHQVLAVTFTNKAAREMTQRAGKYLSSSMDGWWLGTFHAIGARILRQNAQHLGLNRFFSILNHDDQLRLMKQKMEEKNINGDEYSPQAILSMVQNWKNQGLFHQGLVYQKKGLEGCAGELYPLYQSSLQMLNACDFGDLILLNLKLFQDHPHILTAYQSQFRYIMVDEYQDTNVAQYLWLRALAMGHKNICVVGDEDQSIYSWRGAQVGNILKFEKDFPSGKVVRLEENYRSTCHILGAACGLISHNVHRLGKNLWTSQKEGEKIDIYTTWDGEDEARLICSKIQEFYQKGVSRDQMVILLRASFQSREFEERLIYLGLPYRVIGGARFYERLEVRHSLAYLRAIALSDALAFESIMNIPRRGLGKKAVMLIHDHAREKGISFYHAAIDIVKEKKLRPQALSALDHLLKQIESWRELFKKVDLTSGVETVLEESGYLDFWRQSKESEANGRLENLAELIKALSSFESLSHFLEHVSLVMDHDMVSSSGHISLMTMHAAKGLEFDYVFLPGWEEGVFPHQKALNSPEPMALEEERRLAYVALTRARAKAIITSAGARRIYNQWTHAMPSRFISEIPAKHVSSFSSQTHDKKKQASYSFNQYKQETVYEDDLPTQYISSSSKYQKGHLVSHKIFGKGVVCQVEGKTLTIRFNDQTIKKIVDSFVYPLNGEK